MANNDVPFSLLNICRFCLSRDEENLIPMDNVLLLTLTLEYIILFTGIQIEDEDKTSFAICVKCTNQLQLSSTFRNTSVNNDALFHELCTNMIAKAKAASCEAIKAGTLLAAAEDTLEIENNSIQYCDIIELDSDDEFSYSANYIKPGEVLHIEELVYRPPDWDMSLNPAAEFVPPHPRVPGKRKLHLCDICGQRVGHIKSHYQDHIEVATLACPYCPVKMKQKKSMNQHITTVHYKTISKTCEICGKGFIHRKTYRYHMISHQEEEKTFECKDCSKTFTNSIYLRDHINRLHNPAKKPKPKDSGEVVRKKRIRSRNAEDNWVDPGLSLSECD